MIGGLSEEVVEVTVDGVEDVVDDELLRGLSRDYIYVSFTSRCLALIAQYRKRTKSLLVIVR